MKERKHHLEVALSDVQEELLRLAHFGEQIERISFIGRGAVAIVATTKPRQPEKRRPGKRR